MEKSVENLRRTSEEVIAMSYQLQGCIAKIPKIPYEHVNFFNTSTDHLRDLGKIIKNESQQIQHAIQIHESKEKNERLEICQLKHENFQLKQKIEELQTSNDELKEDKELPN